MENIEAKKSYQLPEDFHAKERVAEIMSKARYVLEELFGVTDLSTIEGVRLRQIIEQCLQDQAGQITAFKNGETKSMDSIIDIYYEPVYRWLMELYDIRPQDIPRKYEIIDYEQTRTEHAVAEYDNEDQAKQHVDVLRQSGHKNAYVYPVIPDDFKMYLSKLRAESHLV